MRTSLYRPFGGRRSAPGPVPRHDVPKARSLRPVVVHKLWANPPKIPARNRLVGIDAGRNRLLPHHSMAAMRCVSSPRVSLSARPARATCQVEASRHSAFLAGSALPQQRIFASSRHAQTRRQVRLFVARHCYNDDVHDICFDVRSKSIRCPARPC